jgi:hypothetical protein
MERYFVFSLYVGINGCVGQDLDRSVRDGDKLAGLMDCCPLPLPLTIGLLGQEWCQAILSKLFNPQQNQSLLSFLKKHLPQH